MEDYLQLLGLLLSFGIVALASKEIGAFFARYNLPMISGFLFAGVLVGPYVLDIIHSDSIPQLRFIDEISLGFIAFAAGGELYLKDLRGSLKGIAWVTIAQTIATMLIGSISIYFLLNLVPFMAELPAISRVAASIMAASILVARSPSSAIAIINELRAKGPFTRTVLGVTVIIDVAVIILFAISSESADALMLGLPLSVGFILFLIAELVASIILGVLQGIFITFVLKLNLPIYIKSIILLTLGYSIFVASAFVRESSHAYVGTEILFEPLLIAMVASFYVTNWTRHRAQMLELIEVTSPFIYIIFFTLTGDALQLNVLFDVWGIALALFGIRILTIFIGSFAGGMIAKQPVKHSSLSWLAYITQAGVGLGLAKEVAVEFPTFGDSFATLLIAVIVLNQVFGPPLMKWAINQVGEARPRGKSTYDGEHNAFIFGTDDQALAVSRLLKSKGWQVSWVCTDQTCAMAPHSPEDPLTIIPQLNLEAFNTIKAEKADAVITMLSDEENYRICEIFYENYGTKTMVTRLNNLENREKFREIGVLLVYPGTATVRLIDQYARKPETISLIMGSESKTKIREISVRDSNLHGIALRDLRLPTDTLIIAIHRGGNDIVSHGYTRLRVGDIVTVVGSEEHLKEVSLKMEAS